MFEDDLWFLVVEKDWEWEEFFEDYMIDLECKVCLIWLSKYNE